MNLFMKQKQTHRHRKQGYGYQFFQRGNADGQQAHEKILNIANHQGNANQNHDEITPHTCLSSKRTQITNVGEDAKKREHPYTVGGNVNWCNHCGKCYKGFSKN